ncbi:MAG: STAS domain-containing protein [Candidatus Electrothrix aestuarii]|jgi:anti-sigma B factor antagonist|uniref:STAS domain-containing protein n=1 Tax=Candidatus Electrothrix aestuarii TaxID=3062594 RepID=A0AAU8LW90_9BACT|nr:STAS domain-containing protein [Candidatus Electrothrix aestuarii]WPD22450.1 MAG: STAS domain-containing protein [Candidatus Electrothrix sp. GW3-3]
MKIEQMNNCLVVRFEETRLDASSAPNFVNAVCNAFEQLADSVQSVILDMKQIQFADSRGLGSIVLIFHKLKANLLLCGAGEQVEKLIKLTRLDSVLQLYQDIPSALKDA